MEKSVPRAKGGYAKKCIHPAGIFLSQRKKQRPSHGPRRIRLKIRLTPSKNQHANNCNTFKVQQGRDRLSFMEAALPTQAFRHAGSNVVKRLTRQRRWLPQRQKQKDSSLREWLRLKKKEEAKGNSIKESRKGAQWKLEISHEATRLLQRTADIV